MILPGEEERKYLQSAIGYSLTGKTTEHCFFVLYGSGRNGKTTFVETIRLLMADYAHRTDIQALMLHWKERGSAPTPHVAALAGNRFVIASEIPEGRKLNEPLIKDLTGGDSITARFLHANPFVYTPTHKLWLFGNYKPKISGTDLGMWRRVKIIEFPVTIPEDVQRPMDEVIGEFYEEMPGILAWAVEGCLAWARAGLKDTERIQATTAEYRSEQDILQHFIDETCERHPDYKVLCNDLFSSMKTWAETNNEHELQRKSKKWLTYQLQMRGINQDSGRRHYLGIKKSIPS
jgi:putative DNA primase/helicase